MSTAPCSKRSQCKHACRYKDILDNQIKKDDQRDITLYTYSLGSSANQAVMKDLACRVNGIHIHIPGAEGVS